ncbi:hypothetical protein HPB48_016632 [Haemaphysalis longicornis]|uniref:Uncharacterized protein n=1 Tax=Haemaphysalis longicornis TaxID=44386 RepID=A0A9J6FT65_HAELO|nr:hypothetical protein HPB48_016632 [Haemaphysalis longicornis]
MPLSRNCLHSADVYSALVAPELKSNLLVSTWLNSPGAKREDYLGGPYTVKNVHMLNFNLSADNSIEVVNTVDHSKWAVSENPNIHYVCVGTLNRKVSPQLFEEKCLHSCKCAITITRVFAESLRTGHLNNYLLLS